MRQRAYCDQMTTAEHLLSDFVQNADVGIAILDLDLRYRAINPWLATAHGLSVRQHLGKHLREVIGDVALEVEAALAETLATGRPVLNLELKGSIPVSPMRKAWVGNYFPIKDKEGRVQQIAAIIAERASRAATPGDDVVDDQIKNLAQSSQLLRSWKEIAVYLGASRKTAMRWEREYNLPVHRVLEAKGAVVFALKAEVDHWMRVQPVRTGPDKGIRSV